ncbi:MAG: uncharacterized protein Athens101428_661 [Candidatus Berkelbacteria bacterium Athens1014_28]|uniref:HD domain-containing protein n=1 Tax=Candidatus Berkelbacteria bacterium Athens1014_28 TaxID=2017145 RepID=A0A554LKX7_9BACT|nr:MAG: uncharacterized protein Athens101428_661 [Candidatus Berkelbacteria bacterium Athens1014_28]
MSKNIIKKAREFVEKECRKPTSVYGYGPFVEHFLPMVGHCKFLQKKIGGDLEIILLSAWLHDIGSIIYGRKDHHLSSAKIAKEFLNKEYCDQNKIKLILKCIKNHRQSVGAKRNTIEEKIISDADAICNFDMLPGLFYATLVVGKLTPIEAAKSVKKKLENKWKRLHFKESKNIIRPKYDAVMLLLSEISKL